MFGNGGGDPLIQGMILGSISAQNDLIRDQMKQKSILESKEVRNLVKVADQRELEMVVATSTKHAFISDDVGWRAVIRALTKELRMYSPFHKLLDKKNRDVIYVTAQEATFAKRGEIADDLREWAHEFANRDGLMAIVYQLEAAVKEARPESPLLSNDVDGEKATIFRDAAREEYQKHIKHLDMVTKGFSPFPFPYGLKDKRKEYEGAGVRIDWSRSKPGQ